jgi:hypothetical protein
MHRTDRRRGLLSATIALIAVLLPCAPAAAVQHLVGAGDTWEHIEPKLRPGDEVILLPGRHREVVFNRIAGTPDAPITIRSADPRNPSEIAADREGLRIKDARHVIIRDLNVVGGSIGGILLSTRSDGQPGESGQTADPRSDVMIINCTVSRIGPKGQRHGISLNGMIDVRIRTAACLAGAAPASR